MATAQLRPRIHSVGSKTREEINKRKDLI